MSAAPARHRDLFAETLLGFFAPIAPYLEDDSVSEIMINGPSRIYVERGGKLTEVPARFAGVEALMSALRNLAQFAGRELDAANPVLEARFPDGSRVEAVIPPACQDGTCVAIRRFARNTLTLDRLLGFGAITPAAVQILRILIECKQNVVVSGGTASGKTSLLNALASLCPPDDRVVVIEDARELQLQLPHVVQLEAQAAHGDAPPTTIRSLFKATLRLRPDRIVIGEIRGGESLDLLQAMTSGHGGCMTTVHASHADDALHRLETMAMMSDVQLPLHALRAQVSSAVDVVVQVARQRDGRRLVTEIQEVIDYDPTRGYVLRPLFMLHSHREDNATRSTLLPTGELPTVAAQAEALGLELPAEVLAAAREKSARTGAPR
jgi:pilus assembly protein CpaF